MTVRKIIAIKGSRTPFVSPEALVSEVLELLELEDVGALVVSRTGRKIEGIISERDIVRGLRFHGPAVLEDRVSDLMTRSVVTCGPDDPIPAIMVSMDHHSIRHIPVVENGKLVGIVSIRDLIKDRVDELEFDTGHLRAYIAGEEYAA